MLDIILVAVVGFAVGFTLAWLFIIKPDEITLKVLDHLVSRYLDERVFSIDKIAKELGMDKRVVEKAIKKLERAGIVAHLPKRGYFLQDPLVFLSPKDYERALRLTKDDNILYGAYQAPYKVSLTYIIAQLSVVILAVIFSAFAYFNVFGVGDIIRGFLPTNASLELFLLFIIALAIIVADVINNFFRWLTRERYSVIVGFYSGVSYDVSVTDELSGKIPRGAIANVDINVNWIQKLNNFFGGVPVGDVIVYVRGRKTPIVFRSVPYPRELYYVLRSIQLGSLQWRKKHARTLALWRMGWFPFYGYRGKRKR